MRKVNFFDRFLIATHPTNLAVNCHRSTVTGQLKGSRCLILGRIFLSCAIAHTDIHTPNPAPRLISSTSINDGISMLLNGK